MSNKNKKTKRKKIGTKKRSKRGGGNIRAKRPVNTCEDVNFIRCPMNTSTPKLMSFRGADQGNLLLPNGIITRLEVHPLGE